MIALAPRRGRHPPDPRPRPPAARRRWRWRARALIVVGVPVLFAALLGMGFFAAEIVLSSRPGEVRTEGVIVLTGGRDRIDAGLDILVEKRAKRLLISGVNPGTSAEAIRRSTASSADLFACCVDLGRRAATTRGNALEAADWAALHGFRSLAVVTSGYHLPRAILEMRSEFRRRGLNVSLTAVAVNKDALGAVVSTFEAETLRLLVAEYAKYMLAHARFLAERLGLPPDIAADPTQAGVGAVRRS